MVWVDDSETGKSGCYFRYDIILKLLRRINWKGNRIGTDMERKFIRDNSISKEEFMAQFEDESMEIVVRINDTWKKGRKPFPKFGKESIASMDYIMPWLAEPELPHGPFGMIFWFCKKSLFGYPYKPEFKSDKICLYRLRVRPGRFSDRPNVRYYFLEEVLEENVDLIKDDAVYKKALERYSMNTEGKVSEMTVTVNKEVDISKREFLSPYEINKYLMHFNAVRFADSGETRMIDGQLEIPFDARDFICNRNLKLEAGSSIRITARKCTVPGIENYYVLDKLLESGIQDNDLKSLNTDAVTPGTWHVDGIEDDLDVENAEATGWVSWGPSENKNDVFVTLACDDDNPKSAALATDHLLKILGDTASFEAKVYDSMVKKIADENGMIKTWEGENDDDVTLTKEEFIKRLRITDLFLAPDGSGSVMVNLNGMFTDHDYSVYINADGSCEANGLAG